MADLSEVTAKRAFLEIQTLGSKGLRYRTKLPRVTSNGWKRLEACRTTDVKDTAGAGDWCTAGIIHRLGKQGFAGFKSTTVTQLQQSIRFGQALAAWTCKFEGARGGMYEVSSSSFQNEVASLMAQFSVAKTPQSNDSTASGYTSGSTPNQAKTTGNTIVRLTATALPQDACCF
jgi:fructokinase